MHINDGMEKNIFSYIQSASRSCLQRTFFCWMKITFTLLVGYNRKVLLCCYICCWAIVALNIDNSHKHFRVRLFFSFFSGFRRWFCNLKLNYLSATSSYRYTTKIIITFGQYVRKAIFMINAVAWKINDKNKIIKGRNNGKTEIVCD